MAASQHLELLHKAIENLYTVFAHYPIRSNMPYCPCCVSLEDNRSLCKQPLRQIHRGDLDKFSYKALTTWGTVDDFKHYLPRLFECLASDTQAIYYCDPEILLGKLNYGNWDTWPEDQQAAVREFMMAELRVLLDLFTEEDSVQDWLCSVGQAEKDLTPYLTQWENHPSLAACEHLAYLLIQEGNNIIVKGKLSNAFWEEHRSQMRQVITWLASPKVHALLENNILTISSPSIAEQLSLALTIQEALSTHLGIVT